MTIGGIIRQLRESRGLTQDQLGEQLGVGPSAVSAWENDVKVPRMGVVEKMAAYFSVEKSYIMCPDEKTPSGKPGERNIYTQDILSKLSEMKFEEVMKIREVMEWIQLEDADFAAVREIVRAIRRNKK